MKIYNKNIYELALTFFALFTIIYLWQTLETKYFVSVSLTAIGIIIGILEIEYFVTGSVVDIGILISIKYHLPSHFVETEGLFLVLWLWLQFRLKH